MGRGSFEEAYSALPPWDIGRPQRELVRLAEEGGIRGAVLDAGCGTGENALFLAALGHPVTGIDMVGKAIRIAREKSERRSVPADFYEWDALEISRHSRARVSRGGNAMVRRIASVFLCLVVLTASGGLWAAAPDNVPIPPGEAGAKAALERSPRHHEWVDIAVPGKETNVTAFVAYPERKEKAPVVIVIQEVYGLTDWIRAVADRLAADGFIAIAPDLLSGKGPGGGGTDKFGSRDDVVKAVRGLSAPDVDAMLDAVTRYGRNLPAAREKVATLGFCWGGGQSFRYATVRPDLAAAVVYYGTSPDRDALGAIRAPVLGLYGEDDARVNATVGPAAEKMKELGKTFIAHTYPGAGHGFLRAQDGRDGANLEASRKAWPATIGHLKKYLE